MRAAYRPSEDGSVNWELASNGRKHDPLVAQTPPAAPCLLQATSSRPVVARLWQQSKNRGPSVANEINASDECRVLMLPVDDLPCLPALTLTATRV